MKLSQKISCSIITFSESRWAENAETNIANLSSSLGPIEIVSEQANPSGYWRWASRILIDELLGARIYRMANNDAGKRWGGMVTLKSYGSLLKELIGHITRSDLSIRYAKKSEILSQKHILVISDFLLRNDSDWLLVLEDDALLGDDFLSSLEAFIDWCERSGEEEVVLNLCNQFSLVESGQSTHYEGFDFQPVTRVFNTTVAYVMSKGAAKQIIRHYKDRMVRHALSVDWILSASSWGTNIKFFQISTVKNLSLKHNSSSLRNW